MQSIDQIRRTNELSKVLKQHGLASDMVEASQKANKITNKNPNPVLEMNKENNQMNNTKTCESMIQKISNLENSKHLLGQRIDTLQNELVRTQEALKIALQKIESMESRVRNIKNQPNQPTQQPTTTSTAPKQEAPTSNDKNKTPSDVSIENIFYCGTR